MSAAAEVFRAEGAEIVGGHTSLGSELTIGFTVTGLTAGDPVTLAGAKPGDVLVLTKPIGSGTVMAAEMALQARGQWVAGALARMAEPQGQGSVAAGGRACDDRCHRVRSGRASSEHCPSLGRRGGNRPCRRAALGGCRGPGGPGVRSTILCRQPGPLRRSGHRWQRPVGAAVRSADSGRIAGGAAGNRGRGDAAAVCGSAGWTCG